MTVAMASSEASPSSSPSSKTKRGLRGPRPQPLKVSASSRGSSPTTASRSSSTKKPVIVYEHTPKVVHARPQEFTTVVQRLTGKHAHPATAATSSSSLPPCVPAGFSPAVVAEEGGDPLLLSAHARAPLASGRAVASTDDAAVAHGGRAAVLPGLHLLPQPDTMQAIQELSPLF